jgi:hypothetical protein
VDLSPLIFGIIASIFAFRRNRKEEITISSDKDENSDSISSLDEYHRNIDWDAFEGDPRLHQAYYMANGYDMDSSFYEVRQYEEDCHFPEAVRKKLDGPWVPGLDRELALVLTGDFSQEQYSRYWQTIFVLDCKHYLPSVHAIVNTRWHELYCFICRGLSGVVKTVTRKEIFPSEEDSIKTREDWERAVESAQNQGKD